MTDFYVDNMYFGDQTASVGTPPDPNIINFLVDVVSTTDGLKYRLYDEGLQQFVGADSSADGIAPVLEFAPGKTYVFTQIGTDIDLDFDGTADLVASSNGTHPLHITTTSTYDSGAISALSQVVTEGVSGVGRVVTVTVPDDATATDLYYVCQAHAGMGNTSNVVVPLYQSPSSPADLTGYSLVFEDNFDGIDQSPDADNWTFDLGNDGWGNGEAQDYQDGLDDAKIVDVDPTAAVNGALRITAKNADGTITSARVKSDIDVGPYGYYEVRAKLPSEDGAWPAIWLLGDGGRATWPNEGEIDLVEWSSAYASSDQDIISALHYPDTYFNGNSNTGGTTLTSAVDEWHTYQVWWTQDSIKIGVDGTEADAHLVYSKPANATNDTWPFDGPMDMILNIAIGGTLGGTVPTSSFEYAMEVDYVRIYQLPSGPDAAASFTLNTTNDLAVYTADQASNVSNLDPACESANRSYGNH